MYGDADPQQKELFEEMRRIELTMIQKTKTLEQLMVMQFQPNLLERIKEAQGEDPKLQEFREQVEGRWSTPSVTGFVYRRERFEMKYNQKPII